MYKKIKDLVFFGMVMAVCYPLTCNARPDSSVKFATIREENPKQTQNSLVVPYVFSADSLGLTLGVGGMRKGYVQDQMLLGGTALASVDKAAVAIVGLWDYQLPVVERFFFSFIGSVGHYPKQRAYVSAPRLDGVPLAGSNDSDKDDYFEDSGTDNWGRFKLEYVLPMGDGVNSPLKTYKLQGGMLQSSSATREGWNPLQHGTTIVLFEQLNRYQSFDLPEPLGKQRYSTHPLKLGLFHSNVDFPTNPSEGSCQYLAYTKDFSWGEYAEEWDFIELETSKYFDLGAGGATKQQVLALNLWTGYSPSYNYAENEAGQVIRSDNPPFTNGAVLGGMYRMRAYPSNRFNDRAVLYASAEYRWTPVWNPIGNISWLRFLKMDWMQFVPFVEVGRVADEYDVGELVSDMKIDAGLGLRVMLSGVVTRFDMTFSEEGGGAWVMFGHPF